MNYKQRFKYALLPVLLPVISYGILGPLEIYFGNASEFRFGLGDFVLPLLGAAVLAWLLGSAVLASISTSLAEILGGAIALQMLLEIPITWGSVLTTMFVVIMLFSNSYKKIERAIIAFVSVIGLSFVYELFLVDIVWPVAVRSWVVP